MTSIFTLIGFFIFSLVEAIEGYFSIKKYSGVSVSQATRIKIYKSNIIWAWVRTAIYLAVIILFNISFKSIGFTLPSRDAVEVGLIFSIITYIISGGLFILLAYQILMFIFSAKYRSELVKVLEKKKDFDGTDIMLPRSKKEKKLFAFCSFTAGVTEEIAFRGFLIYLISDVFSGLNIYIVLAIIAVIFGILHMYQGPSGIVRTGLTGLLLGALYLATGSLLLPIILHIIVDCAACFLYETVES